MNPTVSRKPLRLSPHPGRVVTRLHMPREEPVIGDVPHVQMVLARVTAVPDDQVGELLDQVRKEFNARHRNLEQTLLLHYEAGRRWLDGAGEHISQERRMLIGAYLTTEYSLQAAAFCNPSLMPAPDQSGVPSEHVKFVLSVRAIGEGHISSIEFRTGFLDDRNEIFLDSPSTLATVGRRTLATLDKRHMLARLIELGVDKGVMNRVFSQLGATFSFAELETSLDSLQLDDPADRTVRETVRTIHWLASSNYVVEYSEEVRLSERVLVPAGPTESEGLEDPRFVRFIDDGSAVYYATYTAYDGFDVLPQLIETQDFTSFRVSTLDGSCARDKGMAIFPRRVDGDYVALSRYDGQSLYLMRTENIRSWDYAERLGLPRYPWELSKMGNCGSPIETDAGWLVLTHGVGPMRVYSIGAMLLDLDDPVRVIGRLREPLLVPEEDERDGYVPNVVYSCGAMLHNDEVVIPFGISDREVGFATVPIEELLSELTAHP